MNKKMWLILFFTFLLIVMFFSLFKSASCLSEDSFAMSDLENDILSIDDVSLPVDGVGWVCVNVSSVVAVGRVSVNVSWDPSVVSVSGYEKNEVDFDYWPGPGFVFDPVAGFVNVTAMNTSGVGVLGDDIILLCLEVSMGVDAVVGVEYDVSVVWSEMRDANIPPGPVLFDVVDGVVVFEGDDEDEYNNEDLSENKDSSNDSFESLPPIADAGGPYEEYYVNEEIFFNGSGSLDPDGYITNWTWDFGDENIGFGITPIHSYPKKGDYTVTLTVTDDDGLIDTDSVLVHIIGYSHYEPPTADTNGPYIGVVNQKISFNGSASSSIESVIVNYSWSCGDGSVVKGVNPIHIYRNPGTYEVILTVTDDKNQTDVAKTTARIYTGKFIDILYGYIIDVDEDNEFDSFLNESTGIINRLQKRDDGTFLIDTNGDGSWNAKYDLASDIVFFISNEPEIHNDSTRFLMFIVIFGLPLSIILFIVLILKKVF